MKQAIYWHDTIEPGPQPNLTGDTETEALIVGGGIAGLTVAQWLKENMGIDALLLEQNRCGGAASGHNSGSIRPGLVPVSFLLRRYGSDAGAEVAHAWNIDSLAHIRRSIARYGISCDLNESGELYTVTDPALTRHIEKEHRARQQVNLSSHYYSKDALRALIGTSAYQAALRYDTCIGINSYKYVLGLRDALVQLGLRVFENTPVNKIEKNSVLTPHGRVKAKYIFVCTDRFAPELGIEAADIYHHQNYLAVSEPLSEDIKRAIFPSSDYVLTALGQLPHYYRLTPDGRLVLGCALPNKVYAKQSPDPSPEIDYLLGYIRQLFPMLKDVEFSHGWNGLYGITRDLFPIAGKLGGHHVALCAGTMAGSVLAAQTAAQVALEGDAPLRRYFAPQRAYTPLDPLLKPFGKAFSFPLANAYSISRLQGPPELMARQQTCVKLAAGALASFGIVTAVRSCVRRLSKQVQ